MKVSGPSHWMAQAGDNSPHHISLGGGGGGGPTLFLYTNLAYIWQKSDGHVH